MAYFAYHRAARAVKRDAVKRVSAAMRERGPDGEGHWFSDDGRVALAHTRLAVIGPGTQGQQPMLDASNNQVLSFNGAIYNHAQLRASLIQRGHHFAGVSDTEVLLAMYREYGEAMLPMLRGMFAFALWDEQRQELIVARDAYGIKPLYYADDGWTVRIASQVRALQCDTDIDSAPDPAGWAGFYLFGSVPEPFTTYRAVRAVPAGSLIRFGAAGAFAVQRWFDLATVVRGGAMSSTAVNERSDHDAIREAVLDSVRAHFVADVPVGLFLSAGIDSTVLLALARELGYQPQAITLAFDEFAGKANDESVLATQLARELGVQHHVHRISAQEFHEQVPLLLAAMDQPSIDGVNTWFVSRAAAQHGLKVALSGIGGDELMAGYPSFRQVPWLARFGVFPARVPGLGTAMARLLAPITQAMGWHPKVAGLMSLAGSYPRAWMLRRGLFMPWELAQIMGTEAAREGLQRLRPLQMLNDVLQPDPGNARARVSVLESAMYLRNQLLRDADWAGMAHGVEIRTPLVDSMLLQTLAPRLMQAGGQVGKNALAQIPSRRLPTAIVQRAKTGFQVPLQAWLQERRSNAIPPHVGAIREWAQQVAAAQ